MDKAQVQIMGVLNVTPDSFFDGGRYSEVSTAVAQAMKMVEYGATIIDIGGESTRPGAEAVSLNEELGRVIPVIEAIRKQSSVKISIDTSKPDVMFQAVTAGAGIINDVYALRQPGALEMAADLNVSVCLMHMAGEPRHMQENPQYNDVLTEVMLFLKNRVECCIDAGIRQENIWLDPGFGFGKTLSHNLCLLKHLDKLVEMGFPVLAGLSRKSMLSGILNVESQDRLVGSLTLAAIAITNGASIMRVHDVKETAQVAKVCEAIALVDCEHGDK